MTIFTVNYSMSHKNNKNCSYMLSMNLLALYALVFCIYSGYVANSNILSKGSSTLFWISYIICILQCAIYLFYYIYIITIRLSEKHVNLKYEFSTVIVSCIIQIGLNIYWVVIYYNYTISKKYNAFAFIKMIEFFSLLCLLEFAMCILATKYILCQFNNSHNDSNSNSNERQKLISDI